MVRTDEEIQRDVTAELKWDARIAPNEIGVKVLHSLRHHVTEGEWEDIKASVPKELTSVLA
jgi:hypothetical protein